MLGAACREGRRAQGGAARREGGRAGRGGARREGGRAGRGGAEASVASRKKEKLIHLLEMGGLYFQGLGPSIWRPMQNGSSNRASTGVEF